MEMNIRRPIPFLYASCKKKQISGKFSLLLREALDCISFPIILCTVNTSTIKGVKYYQNEAERFVRRERERKKSRAFHVPLNGIVLGVCCFLLFWYLYT
jgi:hypothetical protein